MIDYTCIHIYLVMYTQSGTQVTHTFSFKCCRWVCSTAAEPHTKLQSRLQQSIKWLCVGRGGLFWTATWNRIGDLVLWRVLILWILLMLRHFDPSFPGLWKVCLVLTPILEQKLGKYHISTPFCQNLAKCIVSIPFLALCSNVSQGAVLSIPIRNYMYVHVKSRTIAEGYPYRLPTQPIQHTFEFQCGVQLGDVLLGCA